MAQFASRLLKVNKSLLGRVGSHVDRCKQTARGGVILPRAKVKLAQVSAAIGLSSEARLY